MQVMVVDDNPEVGELMRAQLELAGHIVIGPIPRVPDAMGAVIHYDIDCAILDINLGTESVIPIAVALEDRDIPFIFVTGYSEFYARGPLGLGKRFGDHRLLTKPYKTMELLEAITDMVGKKPRKKNGNGNGNRNGNRNNNHRK
jgi:CheY-like chemotaxis protein